MNTKLITTSFPAAVPVVGEYDVVVVGGGIAGCAAAVAAARSGASVCLVEREFMAGGLATLGLVWCYLPICDGNGHQIAGGIAEEFLKLSVLDGSGSIPACWQNQGDPEERKKIRYESEFNPLSFAVQLDRILEEQHISIRYGSQVCAVIKNGHKISAVVVAEKQGLGAICCKTVIDASGDGDVCHLAGEQMPRRTDNRLAYWAYSSADGDLQRAEMQSPLYGRLPENERTFSGVSTEDITAFCVEARKQAYHRCVEKKNRLPIMMASIPQFRMTRRLEGQYVLQTEDEGRWFADAVGMVPDWRKRKVVFCVPYRMLLPKQTDNLWVAGRCASAEAEVGETIRSIPSCAVLGQAAGTAAALACKLDCNAADIPYASLKQTLEANGVILDEALMQLCKA